MSKHTSWRFTKLNGKTPVIVSDSTGGRITYIDDDVSATNARLIAASPDLLAALQEALRVSILANGEINLHQGAIGTVGRMIGDWQHDAKAVIAKAIGDA